MACNHKAYTIYDELLREKKLIESLWLIGINRIRIKKKKKKKTTWKIHNLINFDFVGFFLRKWVVLDFLFFALQKIIP